MVSISDLKLVLVLNIFLVSFCDGLKISPRNSGRRVSYFIAVKHVKLVLWYVRSQQRLKKLLIAYRFAVVYSSIEYFIVANFIPRSLNGICLRNICQMQSLKKQDILKQYRFQ